MIRQPRPAAAQPPDGAGRCAAAPVGRVLGGLLAVSILLRLWLTNSFPLMATWTPHDDYLYIGLAKQILSGKWLGPYTHLTLIKGPGYPLFIAAAHCAGLPLLFAQQLLHCLACLVAALALRPLCHRRSVWLGCFLLLLFNPFLYNYPVPGRAFREGFSISLVLLVFAGALGTSVHLRAGSRPRALARSLIWSLGMGIGTTWLWYTREEGIWLLPPLALWAAAILWPGGAAPWPRRIAALLLPAALFGLATLGLGALNRRHYGAFVINELKTPQFVSAYGGLMNIRVAQPQPQEPVSQAALERAAAASPAVRELLPHLAAGAGGLQMPPSFFIWSLRDAARRAGHAETLEDGLRFYARIGAELAAACREGRLECLDRRPSLRPPWRPEDNHLLPAELWQNLRQAVDFSLFHLDPARFRKWRSDGSPEVIRDFKFVALADVLPTQREAVAAYPAHLRYWIVKKVKILSRIGRGYQLCVPALFVTALLLHAWSAIHPRYRRQRGGEVLLGLVLLGGLCALLATLSFVHLTLWPIRRPLYAAYPVILLYIALALAAFARREAAA